MATTTERTCCDSITRNTRISKLKVAALTTLALLAFAGNSVLCRLALADRSIDAASFSTVRLVSGAVALLAILHATNRGAHSPSYGSWMSAAMLFLYAVCFSFAYIGLDTGVGALILFGMVQLTMVAGALIAGDRPTVAEWIGWLLAIAGFVYLVSPGLTAPSPLGSVLMGAAGIAWGVYSLQGRSEPHALAGTTYNFVRSVPMVIVISAIAIRDLHLSANGIVLAVLSGAITSGVGYAIWYTALRSISSMQAAMVQLSVPVLAAAGGVLFLAESVSLRLIISGLLILGGIFLAIFGKAGFTAA
jgi:drug/metabolite transporter (DMT)-like permease